MPTRKNQPTNGDHDDAAVVEDEGGGFYADSPSDGPNRRGPDTDDASDDDRR